MMKPSVRWPLFVVLIGTVSAVSVGLLIYRAISDPSFAVEENYTERGANWNAVIDQRAANAKLGWTAALRIAPASSDVPTGTADEGGFVAELVVRDRAGDVVRGANVTAEAFHHARAGDQQTLVFKEKQDGRYEAPLNKSSAGWFGWWGFRCQIERRDDLFTVEHRLEIPRPSAMGGGSDGQVSP